MSPTRRSTSAATTTPSSGPRTVWDARLRGSSTLARHRHGHARRLRLGADPARRGRLRLLACSTGSSSGPPPRAGRSAWRPAPAPIPPWLAHAAPGGDPDRLRGAPAPVRAAAQLLPQLTGVPPAVRRAGPPGRRAATPATRRSSPGTSATSTAAPATATCARPASATGCASGTPRLDALNDGLVHHVLVAHVHRLGRRSSRRRRSPSTGAAPTTPRSRASRSTTCGSCPTPCSPTSCDEKAAIRESEPGHSGDHQLHGHVPADRLPPLGRRTSTSRRGTTTRPTTASHGADGAHPRPDARAQGRPAVLADGADPERHRQPRRQPAEAARGHAAVELAGGRARRRRGAVLPDARRRAGRARSTTARCIGHAGRDGHPGVPRGRRARRRAGPARGRACSGARTPARVALLFDWDSWWALEISDGPSRLVRYQRWCWPTTARCGRRASTSTSCR